MCSGTNVGNVRMSRAEICVVGITGPTFSSWQSPRQPQRFLVACRGRCSRGRIGRHIRTARLLKDHSLQNPGRIGRWFLTAHLLKGAKTSSTSGRHGRQFRSLCPNGRYLGVLPFVWLGLSARLQSQTCVRSVRGLSSFLLPLLFFFFLKK